MRTRIACIAAVALALGAPSPAGAAPGGDPDVAALQVGLTARDLYDGDIDGYAGPPTVRAYAEWQRQLGYRDADADGVPGAASLVRLGVRKKDSFKVIA